MVPNSRTKFTSRNLNAATKSPISKPNDSRYGGILAAASSASRCGVVSKPSTVTAPTPINTPSLRKENHGQDVSVNLVPNGVIGWGGRLENNLTTGTLKLAPWAEKHVPAVASTSRDRTSSGKWGDDAVEDDYVEQLQTSSNKVSNDTTDTTGSNYRCNTADNYINSRSSFNGREAMDSNWRPHQQQRVYDHPTRILSRPNGPKMLFDPKSGELVTVNNPAGGIELKRPDVLRRPKIKQPTIKNQKEQRYQGRTKKQEYRNTKSSYPNKQSSIVEKEAVESKQPIKEQLQVDSKIDSIEERPKVKEDKNRKKKVWRAKLNSTEKDLTPASAATSTGAKKSGRSRNGKPKQLIYVPKVKS